MKRWKRAAAAAMVGAAALGVAAPASAIPPKYHGEWCRVENENRAKEKDGEYTWGLCSRTKPEAAARAMKLIITENVVKIGGNAPPWVYEIKNEGPHTRGPNDYWQLHMRGEKEMLTFNYYRTTAKLVRNDGTVEEVPILITENITGGKEHRAYIDMNRRLERMDRIYNEPAPR